MRTETKTQRSAPVPLTFLRRIDRRGQANRLERALEQRQWEAARRQADELACAWGEVFVTELTTEILERTAERLLDARAMANTAVAEVLDDVHRTARSLRAYDGATAENEALARVFPPQVLEVIHAA